MTVLTPSYDLRIVAASFLIASFASYVALDLAMRVRTHERAVARTWWVCGSIAMSTGIWCMHFMGMLAFALPIALGYGVGMTLGSWLAAVTVSGVALGIASRRDLHWRRVVNGALAMGLGICAMHHAGMAALDMAPGIVWNGPVVVASAVWGVVAPAVALKVFLWFRRGNRSRIFQVAAGWCWGRRSAACIARAWPRPISRSTRCASARGPDGRAARDAGVGVVAAAVDAVHVDARRSGQIRGVEALLRWHHPERGNVSPVVFIPVAERFGLINTIGNGVIDDACRQMESWADDGMRVRVAINLPA